MAALKTFVSLAVMASKAPLASMTPNWNVMVLLLLETASTHRKLETKELSVTVVMVSDGVDGVGGFKVAVTAQNWRILSRERRC